MKRINVNRIKLTPYERRIEAAAEEYAPVKKEEFEAIKRALERRKKNAVLNLPSTEEISMPSSRRLLSWV